MKKQTACLGLISVVFFASFVSAVVFLCSIAFAADGNAVVGKWWDEKRISDSDL